MANKIIIPNYDYCYNKSINEQDLTDIENFILKHEPPEAAGAEEWRSDFLKVIKNLYCPECGMENKPKSCSCKATERM